MRLRWLDARRVDGDRSHGICRRAGASSGHRLRSGDGHVAKPRRGSSRLRGYVGVGWAGGRCLERRARRRGIRPCNRPLDFVPQRPLGVTNYSPEAGGGPGFVFGAQAGEAVVLDTGEGGWRTVTQDALITWDTYQIVEAGDVVITLRRNNATKEQRAYVYRPPF
jgi:hypothetical protein